MSDISFSTRFKIAVRETAKWKPLLVGAVSAVIANAFRLHYGKSNMTWTEVWHETLWFGGTYAGIMVLIFIYNFIFAPARLEREATSELKRKAGLESLNQVLAEESSKIAEATKPLDDFMDAQDEDES